uniref:NB-ARC domain-containing protein n=1 Tax=Quercus lobata TaxID=97700 RepID=A0A7N2R2T9_QUELO
MNSFLDMNSNDVCFIGICGKSGMGKTTLARFVFDKIRNQFEVCSFLENVKEVSKACGLETLQEQLLCDISKGALRGTDQIKGMVLNLPPNEEQEELNAEPFSKMNKLKLLKICKLHLPCLSNLSNELLLLEWHEYPLKSLPKSF